VRAFIDNEESTELANREFSDQLLAVCSHEVPVSDSPGKEARFIESVLHRLKGSEGPEATHFVGRENRNNDELDCRGL